MKKILISLALLVSASALMAQLSLGPKIGYTASELTTEGSQIKEEMKNTLHFGAFARLGTKTYLQPELLFMTKGTKFGYSLSDGVQQDVKLNTIDIPVLLGFKLIDLKVANIRAMAGPVGSFVINKDLENVGELDDELKDNNIKDANWGLQAGVGADFLSLTLDIRYEFGLSNMFEGETPADFNTDDIRNNVFLVTLGWKIL
ncbi:MAG TPA: porin family protein [Bacteroidales bacterium]|nr:porin family protein [Bacteroidales bacterium]